MAAEHLARGHCLLFDTVNHTQLFAALRAEQLTAAYVELLEAAYGDMKATVRVDCESREFDFKRGVRQGYPLSPILFNAALEAIMRLAKAEGRSKVLA